LQSLVHDAKSAFSLKSNRPSEWWGNIGKHLARTTNWRWRQTLGAHCVGPFPARQETTESWTFCEVQVYAKKRCVVAPRGTWASEGFISREGPTPFFQWGEQWHNFILSTPTLREIHLSPQKLLEKQQIAKFRG